MNESVSHGSGGRTKIRVLYDVSALGAVAMHSANYTGVQRVAHEVASGLARHPEVDLELFAAAALSNAHQFAANDRALRNCKFINSTGDFRRAAWIHSLSNVAQEELANRSLSRRVKRWAASRGARLLSWRENKLSSAEFRRHDIYHTPVHAFPPSARHARGVAKFLTVYDLTPVRMPEHSHATILEEFRQTVASLPKDAWFLCISENTKRDWCEYTGTDPARCFVTPLAAASYFAPCPDLSRLEAVRSRYGIPEGHYFLSVSTLEPRKNLAAVIQTFAKLLSLTGDQSLYLVLVGRRGWQEQGIFEAADTAVRSRIIFTGYVAEEDLSAIYAGALAFIYMSFYEGFGLPPLEAMQCGTPVVTSNNSSLPEVVGSAGILLDPRDTDGLCVALDRLRTDTSLRQQLRERSLERATHFSWAACLERTVEAYHHALAAR